MKPTIHYVKPLSVAVLTALSISFSGSVFAVAGKFQFVNGEVQVINAAGIQHKVQKGDSIDEGDTVAAAADGFAQIKMEDGGFFAVRPDTQFKIDTFQFNGKTDGSEQGVFSLIKGSLRSVTGLIGKVHRDNYKINTATSVIGIRGSGADVGHSDSLGTAVRTLFGGHSLTSGGKTIVTGPGQIALAPPGEAPRIVPNFPFNTGTSASGKNGDGDKNGGGEKKSDASKSDKAADKGDAEKKSDNTSEPVAEAPEVVIPILTKDGINLTENKTASGAEIGGGTTGTLATTGAGAATVGMFTLTGTSSQPGQPYSYTYGKSSFGIVSSGSEPGGYSYSNAGYVDASGNFVGWKNTLSAPAGTLPDGTSYPAVSYTSIGQLGSATAIRDGADAAAGVVWGHWTAGSTVNDTITSGGTTETLSYTPVGGLAVVGATHITTYAELLQANTWTGAGLSGGGATPILGTYALAPGNFITLVNGVQSGIITSATATLDFTNQAATAFNVAGSGGAFGNWSAGMTSGTSTPIYGGGFGFGGSFSAGLDTVGGMPLTGSCSGGSGSCAGASGTVLVGSMSGGLVGNQAQGIIGTVGLIPQAQANSNMLTEGLGGAVYLTRQGAASSVMLPAGNYGHFISAIRTAFSGSGFVVAEQSNGGWSDPSTNFALDSNGAPIKITSTELKVFDAGGALPGVNGIPSSLVVSGGTTTDAYHTPDNSVYISRGSNVVVTTTCAVCSGTDTFGTTQEIMALVTAPAFVQTLTGSTSYTLAGNTHPTDALGNVGTLNSAYLNANFTAQTASYGVNVSIANKTLDASATNIPIVGDYFSANTGDSNLATTCSGSGCTGVWSGAKADVSGGIVGNGAATAVMAYHFSPSGDVSGGFTDYVHGLAAFTAGSTPTATSSVAGTVGGGGAAVGILNAGSFNDFNVVDNVNFGVRQDISGNVIAWVKQSANYGTFSFAAGNGSVVQDGTDAANGVVWGRWGAYIATNDNNGKNSNLGANGGLSVVAASHITTTAELANYASFTGSGLSAGNTIGTYSLAAGSFPTGVNGTTSGTVTSASATLNFSTAQITAFSVAGSGGAFGNWSASGSGSIANFMAKNGATGISLSGTCGGGSGACATSAGPVSSGSVSISGSAVGGFVGTQAQGLISTIGLAAGSDKLGGAVYMKR